MQAQVPTYCKDFWTSLGCMDKEHEVRQWCSYLPTSSFQPHICRSLPGKGDADGTAAAGEWCRWPRVFGPHPTPPGSEWSLSQASCGRATHPSLRSEVARGWNVHALLNPRPSPSAHLLPRLHPTRVRTGKTPLCSGTWCGCHRRPFSHCLFADALLPVDLQPYLARPPPTCTSRRYEPNFTDRPQSPRGRAAADERTTIRCKKWLTTC